MGGGVGGGVKMFLATWRGGGAGGWSTGRGPPGPGARSGQVGWCAGCAGLLWFT